jgi:hypothetical protein
MVRQRISEYNCGASDWANDNGAKGTSAANPKPRKLKRRIHTRATGTWEILLSTMEFTSVSDSAG